MANQNLIKPAELRSYAELANEQHVVVEVEKGDLKIRIIPDRGHDQPIAAKAGVRL